MTTYAFHGTVGDLSADGERLAALAKKHVLFWAPGEGIASVQPLPGLVTRVRLSPRDRVAALLGSKEVTVVDTRTPGPPLFTLTVDDKAPDQLRWDDGGLDLAVCGPAGGRWHYLRRGRRAKEDPPPKGEACAPPRPRNQPEPIAGADDYRELADRDLGPHLLSGGFRLRHHRYLSRDLVLFDGAALRIPDAPDAEPRIPPAAGRLLRFEGKDEIGGAEAHAEGDAVVAVERDDPAVMFQVGEEMRFYASLDGARLFTRKGTFVRRCADGRWLSYAVDGDHWRLTDGWTGGKMADVPREPALVIGADATCANLYTQRLDGTLVATPIAGGPPRTLAVADGYVYLARPSPARGGGPSGVLVAVSSGAVARIDDGASAVRVLAYATPRATALADGPQPGDVVFADVTGVVLLRPGTPPSWLRDISGGVEWEDISTAPDGSSLLLASDDRLGVIDLVKREMLGSIPVEGRGRLARWDDEGSVLAWSFARTGGPVGTVIPRGVSLARAVSAAISNLGVEKGRITILR